MLEFDISLRSLRERRGKGQVSISVVDASFDASNANENLSRVKFRIPITFPYTILEDDASNKCS